MLTTIQELEQEIDQFKKNIKDSNELMEILVSMTSLMKIQTDSFETRTKELQEELAEFPPELADLGQQLELKYNAFLTKLEATNMDQLYKYCQDMNKSINTKLSIALGGVAVAVIVSIVSLFI